MAAAAVTRILRAAMATLATTATVLVASSCAGPSAEEHSAYCAIVPDSIGLYAGNPVTQMGYQIGTVTSITANPADVRIDFSLIERRLLPADVKAVIRSPSILADRALELVGNYDSGPQLEPGSCVPLERSVSPKSISEVIGSAHTMLDSINPDGSTNISDTVRGLDQLARDNGTGVNQLLTASSDLLDSPDQAISDIGSIIQNTAQLTTVLRELRDPIKQILLDAQATTPDLVTGIDGAARLSGAGGGYGTLGPLIELVAVLETRLGEATQITLDTVSASVRKLAPRANAISDLIVPVPWWINAVANHFNGRQFHTFNIAYRPPLYRVRTHDGLALCGMMNASVPGSCADVNGQPFAVDVALLQYVLTQASR